MKKLILTILLAAGTLSVHAGYCGYPYGWGWGFYPSISFSFGVAAASWYPAAYYPAYPVYPAYNYGCAYIRPVSPAASVAASVADEAPARTPANTNTTAAQKTAPASQEVDPMSSANSLFGR